MEQRERAERLARSALELELAAKEKEIVQLVEDLRRLQAALAQLQDSSAQQITRLEEQLDQKNQRLQAMEARLDSQRDYEDMKRELSILKSVEFPSVTSVSDSPTKPLEMLLLERTKALQSENASLKVTNSSLQGREESLTPTPQPHPVAANAIKQEPGHVSGLPNGGLSSGEDNLAATPNSRSSSSSGGTAKSNGAVVSSGGASADRSGVLCSAVSSHAATAASVLSIAGVLAAQEENNKNHPFRFDERGGLPYRFEDRLGEPLIPKGDPMEARLQEMLRYNMDKYANQNLDTLHIARRVRELLSIHNIGQRLFAKYVLGLSQGTVSELLSKPKPWDKLTEKGRDSYRKMHAWATDENAVLLLKSLIPKKGKESGLTPFTRGEDTATEERIAHILSEASQAMKTQTEDSHSNDSKSPTQEKVAKIYQEELAKLMGRRLDDGIRGREQFQSLLFPHFFSGALIDRTQEEIRMALDIYHRELAKLNAGTCVTGNSSGSGNGTGGGATTPTGLPPGFPAALLAGFHQNGMAQDLSLPKERKSKMMNGRPEGGGVSERAGGGGGSVGAGSNGGSGALGVDDKKEILSDGPDALRHAGSAFSLVRPKSESGQTGGAGGGGNSPLSAILPPTPTSGDDLVPATASPLQRMASITNSLISQPPTPNMPSPSQRPLKAVLPPITQQQFDQYNNMNTEDIVKKVKEQLSQYSISQRLFGESVLGLSQGSVSDLLARPKPWHMLTQKGREPFIRMKMFLEDENAVHKLVASQYKIAPEKLMRTGGYGSNPLHLLFPYLAATGSTNKPGVKTPDLSSGKGTLCESPLPPIPPSSVSLASLTSQGTPVSGVPPPPLAGVMAAALAAGGAADAQASLLKKQPSAAALRSLQHMQPSVYEMAALTQDLDTQQITTKIKEALLANNIGQKIFGEVVLGLSQGSVSELLSKPKPWHMLSIKGREPFIRMQLWLNDPQNVEKLQQLKNERREANKRRRTATADNGSDTSSNDTADFYHNMTPSPSGPPSAKKQRVLFSEEQKEALRLAFALDPYPNMATIEFLAQELALSSRTITNWFHNHRMRLKQQVPHPGGTGLDGVGMPVAREGQQQFDPVQFRLLLNQRLIELQKERNPSGLVVGALGPLAGQLPYPFFNSLGAVAGAGGALPLEKEQLSGLDLSMAGLKRGGSSSGGRDIDCDSNASSESNGDDSNLSGGSYRAVTPPDTDVAPTKKELPIPPAAMSRSSRRKPAAPQWVNPDWQDSGDEKDKEVIINGVCVMQTDDFDMKNARPRTEETIRIEPTPVVDRETDSDDEMDDDDDVAHPPTSQKQQQQQEPRTSPATNGDPIDEDETPAKDDDEDDVGDDDPCNNNVKSKESSPEPLDASERRENIEKLKKRLEKEDEEDWEF